MKFTNKKFHKFWTPFKRFEYSSMKKNVYFGGIWGYKNAYIE